MKLTVANIVDLVESSYPKILSEPWDRVGLVVGDIENEVKRVLLTVDVVHDVVEEAIDNNCDLIISHHPLFLQDFRSITTDFYKSRLVYRLIENNISLLTVHTNGDSALFGVSDAIINVFDIDKSTISSLSSTVQDTGLGRVACLNKPVRLENFAETVLKKFPSTCSGIKVMGDRDSIVERIAVCGGSGGSLLEDLDSDDNIDVYITADLKHHTVLEFREKNFSTALVDVSHWGSEYLWLELLKEVVDQKLDSFEHNVVLEISSIVTDPWDFSIKYDTYGGIV